MIARVIVEIGVRLDREFDYLVPASLADRVRIGARVMVPFGAADRKTRGTVVAVFPSAAARSDALDGRGAAVGPVRALKSVLSVCDAEPLIGPRLMELARWMASYYAAPLEMTVRALLPVAVRERSRGVPEVWMVGPVKSRPDIAPREGLRCRKALTSKQAGFLEWLKGCGAAAMPLAAASREAGVSTATIKVLARRGEIVLTREKEPAAEVLSAVSVTASVPPVLMPQQRQALKAALLSIRADEPRVMLLHGVTGSGKTEVYLQAISEVLADGGGAIMLVPEIALTPQTVERFRGRFGETVAVLHSHLSAGDRYEQWHRLHQGLARVAVGARSAVFAPVRSLRLIVVDEEHEPSYKQEECPRYQARDVAVMRGRLESCAVLLGSATPSLESYYNARCGKYELMEMPHRIDHRRMPLMRVIDMRTRVKRSGGGSSFFSTELIESIQRRLERGEQSMLFLNRRGYAAALVCPACGYVAECESCSLALTYHRATERLRCHWCDASARVPPACPKCRDPDFKYAGIGTQRVETALRKICPRARIVRMDRDTTRARDSYGRILGDFRQGKIDILVGTQMIAKGLDFPNVTLIGVVQADIGLHMPDFRAAERTFQLLTQVAGRAGRGEVPGEVVVQTFTPYHESVQAARRMDYAAFFDREIEFRRELNYPPHSRMTRLVFSGAVDAAVADTARRAGQVLRAALESRNTIIVGPAPAPMARVRKVYRHHLLVRSKAAMAMNRALRQTLEKLKRPKDIGITLDVDAHSVM